MDPNDDRARPDVPLPLRRRWRAAYFRAFHLTTPGDKLVLDIYAPILERQRRSA